MQIFRLAVIHKGSPHAPSHPRRNQLRHRAADFDGIHLFTLCTATKLPRAIPPCWRQCSKPIPSSPGRYRSGGRTAASTSYSMGLMLFGAGLYLTHWCKRRCCGSQRSKELGLVALATYLVVPDFAFFSCRFGVALATLLYAAGGHPQPALLKPQRAQFAAYGSGGRSSMSRRNLQIVTALLGWCRHRWRAHDDGVMDDPFLAWITCHATSP